ncbi:MAG: glycosyltransferase [Goleter apudmare HA4340-LM2]|nr:glycosyltransferase [Goleter apudmare HA4340-LM2]
MINFPITLKDLPLPPEGKTGWPWTEEFLPLAEKMPDGSAWPRITIVSPSYNQGHLIEETIRSILLQGYPNLEYIIVDGGSTDQTSEVIQKYQKYITYWVNHKPTTENEAVHKVNQGFKKSTGEICGYLNTDDLYLPGTLKFVAEHFVQHPHHDFICAQTTFIDGESKPIKGFEELFMVEINHITMTEECHIAQQSTFFRANTFEKIGYFNENFIYCFDYEFWLRAFIAGLNFEASRQVISKYRLHTTNKTTTAYSLGKFDRDFVNIYQSYLSNKELKPLYRKGIYRGLAKASCLLFVHLESSQNIHTARRAFLQIILQRPGILLVSSIWPTLIVATIPIQVRELWRKIKHSRSKLVSSLG